MKKILITAALATIASAASPAFAQSANLVANGDFSTITKSANSTTGNSNFQLTGNNTYGSVANWATTGGYNLLYNISNANVTGGNAYGAYTGTGKEYIRYTVPTGSFAGNFIALDGDATFASPLTQTISGLVAGQAYTLSFDWMANQIVSRDGTVTDGIRALIGGNTYNTAALAAPSGVQHAAYTFTYASGASNVLSFLSTGSPAGQPPVALLDNVRLSAVPEPATWAMMLVGVGMVGGALRQRRRKGVAAIA